MFKNLFKTKKKENIDNNILIASLLIHSAKIDNNYTDHEKKIIKQALINLKISTNNEVDALLKEAEKKEEESNQIVEFTKEIKKNQWNLDLK